MPFAVVVAISLVVLFAPSSATPPAAPGVDKLVHVALFAALAMTGRLGGLARPGLAAALVSYAVASEVLQGVLPIGRSADPLDALLDVLGVLLGLLFADRVRSR